MLLALAEFFEVELLAIVEVGLVNPCVVSLVFELLAMMRVNALAVGSLARSSSQSIVVGLLAMARAADLVEVSLYSNFTKRILLKTSEELVLLLLSILLLFINPSIHTTRKLNIIKNFLAFLV